MIQSRSDYLFFKRSDIVALGIKRHSINSKIRTFFLPNRILRFQVLMRRCEYYTNVKKGLFNKLILLILRIRYNRLSLRLGFSIPLNVFGPGLSIAHYGTIVVSAYARVGKNCRLHPSTCIGASGGINAPVIGDNVYIGPGAKIYGKIKLGNNIAVGANAAVGDSFEEDNILIGGVPAKKIGMVDISNLIKHLKQV
jgi:serine O-acetyltransferase